MATLVKVNATPRRPNRRESEIGERQTPDGNVGDIDVRIFCGMKLSEAHEFEYGYQREPSEPRPVGLRYPDQLLKRAG